MSLRDITNFQNPNQRKDQYLEKDSKREHDNYKVKFTEKSKFSKYSRRNRGKGQKPIEKRQGEDKYSNVSKPLKNIYDNAKGKIEDAKRWVIMKKPSQKKPPTKKKHRTVIELRNIYAQSLKSCDRRKVHQMKYCGEYCEAIEKQNLFKEMTRFKDAFGDGSKIVKKNFITQENRTNLLDNLFAFFHACRISDLNTLFLAVQILDRFMYKILVTSKELKLAAFVSLEIAEKFEEIYPAPLADYLTSLQSKISKADFISAEGRILHKLEYRVNYIPTSLTFQQRFYIILRLSKKQKILSSYILMASLTDKEIIYEYPSLVALASICLACKKIDSSLSKPQNARDCYFKDYQLEDCIKSFADIVPLEKETLSSKLLKIMKILKRVCERIISKPNRYKYALQLMPDKSVRNVLMSEFERQIKL